MKEKLVDYITNPVGGDDALLARHASPDDTGVLYGGVKEIFTPVEEESGSKKSGTVERVLLSDLLKKPTTITSFACHQVRENGYMIPSHLVLTRQGVLLVRCIEGE